MDYEAFFRTELDGVRDEGRYRVFTDIKRHRGRFQPPRRPFCLPKRRRRGRQAQLIRAWRLLAPPAHNRAHSLQRLWQQLLQQAICVTTCATT